MCNKYIQQAHHDVGRSETPRRLIRKLCRYSSLNKLEDAFDAAVHLTKAVSRTISKLQAFSAFRIRFAHFSVVFNSILQPTGAGDANSGRFVGPLVLDKHVKLHDPGLSRSRKIPTETVGGVKIDCFPL